mmetsp:Transcript_56343/g.178336  ORF Transcript_56343/g.178336 Transcript_56343/m.178336 type:complete len:164 (+) Transcript_56343:2-493(+)
MAPGMIAGGVRCFRVAGSAPAATSSRGPSWAGRARQAPPRMPPARGVAASSGTPSPPLLSVAPMMDWTDVHFRHLARLISRHTWMYTEMVVDNTITHNEGSLDRWLWLPPDPGPQVLQLGGSNPDILAQAAALAKPYGYSEINLNCGCPRCAASTAPSTLLQT